MELQTGQIFELGEAFKDVCGERFVLTQKVVDRFCDGFNIKYIDGGEEGFLHSKDLSREHRLGNLLLIKEDN